MGAKKVNANSDNLRKIRPAMSEEARENQMIALAIDQVEERMRTGKASSAEYVHFLKLASSKEKLEKEKAIEEVKLLKAKTEAIESSKRIEELYEKAINAMSMYAGNGN